MDRAAIDSGLVGYNATLLGAAFAAFLPGSLPWWQAAAAVAAGGVFTVFVFGALSRAVKTAPHFTLAFNIVTLTVLAHTKPLALGTTATAEAPLLRDWLLSPLVGVAQIFVNDDAVCGGFVLAALAVQGSTSGHGWREGAEELGAAVLGSSIGVGVAALLDAPSAEIVAGLHGFNPALTALAVAQFVRPGAHQFLLACGGAAATVVVNLGLVQMFAMFQIPAGTLPFCVVAYGCMMVVQTVPGLTLRSEFVHQFDLTHDAPFAPS